MAIASPPLMRFSEPHPDPTVVVVVGASAGGVGVLQELVRGVPSGFPGALFVVLHSAPEAPGRLAQVLARSAGIDVRPARDGEPVTAGRAYVAPPDRHLILREEHVHLSRGPRENGTRPAIDPLFRSAAAAYGARAVGVVLTGTLDDGTAGLLAIEAAGGVTIVQDPEEAPYPDMPRNALEYVRVQHVLRVAEIPPLLTELGAQEAAGNGRGPSVEHPSAVTSAGRSGPVPEAPAGFSCPECAGSLWSVSLGDLMEYRCHVGHRYTPESLLFHLGERRDQVVEAALRGLDEEAILAEELARRAREADGAHARRYARRAEQARTRARALRELLGSTAS